MSEAAYRRLSRELRTAILRRQYARGARLPTELELSRTHGLSRQTVRRAFQDLVSEGLVERVPGRGTFVVEAEPEHLTQHGTLDNLMSLPTDTVVEVVEPLQVRADLATARRLRAVDDRVETMVLRRFANDELIGVSFVAVRPEYLPPEDLMSGFREIGRRSSKALMTIVDESGGHPIAEAHQRITAVAADERLAALAQCRLDEPMLCVERLFITSANEPVELATSYFVASRYSYDVRLHRTAG